MQIDDTDRRLLRRLPAHPGANAGELADLAGVTPTTYSRRLDRLTKAGVIRGQHAVIDWAALGYIVNDPATEDPDPVINGFRP